MESFDREKYGSVRDFYNSLNFNSDWIVKGADLEMVKFAEKAGVYMAPCGKNKRERDKDKQCLSKSQIRNVYGEIKRIQFKDIQSDETITSFMLLKPKVAYAEGRNRTMGLSLFKYIFDDAWAVTGNKLNKKTYDNFCALLESILAYHKAKGGE